MNFIAIDTTNENLYVVLSKNGEPHFKEVQIGKTGHSRALMPAVCELLTENGLEASDIGVYAVVAGPGSFTGIRIGVAAITALSYATASKRVQVTSFDLIAYNRQKVEALVDAGHGNLYAASCENGKTLKCRFVEAAEAAAADGVFVPIEPISQTLFKVVEKKISDGEFCKVYEPFYMRKSQAERAKNEI